MPTLTASLEALVAAINQGDLDALKQLLLPEYFSYAAQPGEPNAPQALGEIVQALRAASPDLSVTLGPLAEAGGEARGPMTVAGTFSGSLWDVPGDNARHTMSATVVARADGGRLALRWEQPALVPMLRELRLVPKPEEAHLKPNPYGAFPEIIRRLIFNNLQLAEKPCSHLDRIRVTEPAARVCEQCLASGDEWPALRMCLECGFVGCCDLSVNKHVKKHCEATGHVLIRSVAAQEAWIWCYADSAFLSSRHLHPPTA